MDTFFKIIGAIVTVLAIIFIFAILMGYPVMWLWNWLIPVIFGLTKINIWQAIGLNLLCGLLIRSSSINKIKE